MRLRSLIIIGVFGPLFFGCNKAPTHPRDWNYREVPSHLGQNPKAEYLILLGADMTYGTAVAPEQTMAHLLDQQSFHYKVYNRAAPKSSFEDLLVSLENRYYLKEVSEASGAVLIVLEKDFDKTIVRKALPKIKAALADPKVRWGFLCEQPTQWSGINCLKISFKNQVLNEEAQKAILQHF